jgi:hypothetical protein
LPWVCGGATFINGGSSNDPTGKTNKAVINQWRETRQSVLAV